MTRSVVNQIGGVDEESWVRAACASEFIGVPDVVHHFDHDRKKTCLERLFEDARIRKARADMKLDDDGIHIAVHKQRTDLNDIKDEDWPIDEFGWHTVVAKLVEIGIDDAEDAFMYIDADGGGSISYEELLDAVQKLGLDGTEEDCKRMMKQAD